MTVRLHNTLTRTREVFAPARPGAVHMYSCGPTVYRYVHLGNLRTYLMSDWVKRVLLASDYRVRHVINITDVGHMRQDVVDRGEDKVIAQALREGRTPQEITAFYTQAFLDDLAALDILPADHYPRATEYVPQMIAVVERLLRRGLAYDVNGTIYFDVGRFPEYGRLSGTYGRRLLEGVRGELDPGKHDTRDFALWKRAEPGRVMKWASPWGEGFPGWHIECTAMSTSILGYPVDIHSGGVDNIFPHHEDELAQSEGAFGPGFVNYWLHGQHLLVDGLKMAKSTGNTYTLADLRARGYDPLAFRYLCMTVRYRARLNFTFRALRGAQRALDRLRRAVAVGMAPGPLPTELSPAAVAARNAVWEAAGDDLNLPRALSAAWSLAMGGALDPRETAAILLDADRLFGLRLLEAAAGALALPTEVARLAAGREATRAAGDHATSDRARADLVERGYEVEDLRPRTVVLRRFPGPPREERFVTRSADVADLRGEPSSCDVTVAVVGRDVRDEVLRAVRSALRHPPAGRSLELIVVDAGSTDGTAEAVRALADRRVRVFEADHDLGAAAARNVALRQARGAHVVIFEPWIELTGDALSPLMRALEDPGVGIAGPFGLRTADMHHFEPAPAGEVDAVELYLMALRRDTLRRAGLMDEHYRFYRNLDIDYSFAVRARGLRAVAIGGLPLVRHPHRAWESLSEEERAERSKRNFDRLLRRWRHRPAGGGLRAVP